MRPQRQHQQARRFRRRRLFAFRRPEIQRGIASASVHGPRLPENVGMRSEKVGEKGAEIQTP